MSDIQNKIGYVNGVGNLAVIEELTSDRELSLLLYCFEFLMRLQQRKKLIFVFALSTTKGPTISTDWNLSVQVVGLRVRTVVIVPWV